MMRSLWVAALLSALVCSAGYAKPPKTAEQKAQASEKRAEKRKEKQQSEGNRAVTCKDGTVDYPGHANGACSHHKGVR
jgi:hypothetical protein